MIIPEIHLIFDLIFDSIFDLILFNFTFNFHIGTTPVAVAAALVTDAVEVPQHCLERGRVRIQHLHPSVEVLRGQEHDPRPNLGLREVRGAAGELRVHVLVEHDPPRLGDLQEVRAERQVQTVLHWAPVGRHVEVEGVRDVQEPEQIGNVGHVRGLWQAKIPAVAILLEEGLVQYTLQAAAIAEEALVDRDLNLRPVVADGRDFEDALRPAGLPEEGEPSVGFGSSCL